MSSPWTERQGQVGDLACHSKEELCEILSRQDKILANKRFIQKLPDKGKKISEFAERVRLAIAHLEEQERKQNTFSFTEFQSQYQQAFSQQRAGVRSDNPTSSSSCQNGPGEEEKDAPLDGETMETVVAAGGSLISGGTEEESELAEALGRVSLSHASSSSTSSASAAGEHKDNYFLGKHPQKKAHFMDVLEKNEHNPTPRRQRFKPNFLGPRTDSGSPSGGSLSPGRSSPGEGLSPSPTLSAEARKERDRKHLDDITAARLPLLHHDPAKLLSLEESAELQQTQAKKQQELQAKLAAQKLSEGLRSTMGSFHPDGGPTAAYREVRDDGAQLSSEED